MVLCGRCTTPLNCRTGDSDGGAVLCTTRTAPSPVLKSHCRDYAKMVLKSHCRDFAKMTPLKCPTRENDSTKVRAIIYAQLIKKKWLKYASGQMHLHPLLGWLGHVIWHFSHQYQEKNFFTEQSVNFLYGPQSRASGSALKDGLNFKKVIRENS